MSIRTFLFLLLALGQLFSATAQEININEGLLSYFSFEDGQKPALTYSLAYDASIVAIGTEGDNTKALTLNGNRQHILLDDGVPQDLLGTQEKMIVCRIWPKHRDWSSFLFMGPPTGQCGRGGTLRIITGALGSLGVDISCGQEYTSVQILPEQWNLVYLHFKDGVFELGCINEQGVNGEQITNLDFHNLREGVAMIGGNEVGRSYLSGMMDEVRFYNRRLTDCELLSLWHLDGRDLSKSACADGLTQDAPAKTPEAVAEIEEYPMEEEDFPMELTTEEIKELAIEEEVVSEAEKMVMEEEEEEVVYESQEMVAEEEPWQRSQLTPEIRQNLVQRESMFTRAETVSIQIWDGRRSDSERVDLYFNGKKIASDLMLTNQPKAFEVTLLEGINNVRMVPKDRGRQLFQSPIIKVTDGWKDYYLTWHAKANDEVSMIVVKE